MTNRKIVHHVTRQYMKKNKKRTFTTLFGIVCMVMLMTCVFVGKETAMHYLETLASQDKGKWHVSAYDVNAKQYEELKQVEHVKETVVSANYEHSEFAVSANAERPFLQMKAYDEAAFDWMNIRLTEGRLPENKNEIVINVEAVEDGAEVKVGDTVSVDCFKRYIVSDKNDGGTLMFPYYNFELPSGKRLEAPQGFPYYGESTEDFHEEHESVGIKNTYTVVGFIEKPVFEREDAAGYTAICLLEEGSVAGERFNVSMQFDLRTQDDFVATVKSIVDDEDRVESNDMVMAFSGNSSDNTINTLVNVMSVFFVVLIIVASVVLIYNVFNMSFEERSKYLGMLSSVGATGKQKRSSVYYEAFILLLVALPMGFVVGLLVIQLGMQALKPYIDQMFGAFAGSNVDKVVLDVSVSGIIFTILFSVITVWISAYLPARKIGKIGPIECIRGNASRSKRKHAMNKRVLRMFGTEGMLASNSISRQKKKTRGIIAAVSVFMMILIVTTFGTVTLNKMITYIMVDDGTMNPQFDYDYTIATNWGDNTDAQYESMKEQLLADENVADVKETFVAVASCVAESDVLSEEYWSVDEKIMDLYGLPESEKDFYKKNRKQADINFVGLDDETFAKVAAATGADESIIQNASTFPVIAVQEGMLSTHNDIYGDKVDLQVFEIKEMTSKQVGESFDVLVKNEKDETKEFGNEYCMSVTVAGYATNEQLADYVTFNDCNLWVITNKATMEKMSELMMKGNENLASIYKMAYAKFENPVCPLNDTLSQMSMDTLNGEADGVLVYSKASFDAETMASALNSAIRVLLICFVILTSIICLLNLYNSARGRIAGRKKEYAILRSMGMTDDQLHKMLAFECGLILTRSILVAVLVSTPVIVMVQMTLSRLIGAVSMPNVWWVYIVAILIAAVALFAITFITFKVEKTENILEDIRRESV